MTKPREVDGKTVKGINFFEPGDSAYIAVQFANTPGSYQVIHLVNEPAHRS